MGKGLQAYDKKMKREMRRRNHIAYDLASPKYRQRVKNSKKFDDDNEDWSEYFDND